MADAGSGSRRGGSRDVGTATRSANAAMGTHRQSPKFREVGNADTFVIAAFIVFYRGIGTTVSDDGRQRQRQSVPIGQRLALTGFMFLDNLSKPLRFLLFSFT